MIRLAAITFPLAAVAGWCVLTSAEPAVVTVAGPALIIYLVLTVAFTLLSLAESDTPDPGRPGGPYGPSAGSDRRESTRRKASRTARRSTHS
jgi:hypothetical protein